MTDARDSSFRFLRLDLIDNERVLAFVWRHARGLYVRRRCVGGLLCVPGSPPGRVVRWDGRQWWISPAPARAYNLGHGSPGGRQDLVAASEDEVGVGSEGATVSLYHGNVAITWADFG